MEYCVIAFKKRDNSLYTEIERFPTYIVKEISRCITMYIEYYLLCRMGQNKIRNVMILFA